MTPGPPEDPWATLGPGIRHAWEAEAQAALRWRVHAQLADKEGRPGAGRLFRALALSADLRGGRLMRLLGLLPATEANLQAGMEAERRAADLTYASLAPLAHTAGETVAARVLAHCRDVGRRGADLCEAALTPATGEQDQPDTYFLCSACGWLAVDPPPERCPICQVTRDRFLPCPR